MKLPVRKCYHAAKVGFFLIIVITILTLFEQWRGGKRSAKAETYDPGDVYEKQILEDEARIIPGLGEGGVAAHLVGEDKRLGEESEKKLAINVYLSDRIAYNRTLKDYRNPACNRIIYDAELPSASVILIFHNEPYSVVVRTIWSVINSARRDRPWYKKANYVDRETGRSMTLGYPGQDPTSSLVYLKEIILVDDNSTLPELKGKLSHYVRTRLPPDLIRILRLPDRVGLTRARLAGARYATGSVLVFLDAHCEAQQDWLRPLLQRIKDFPHAVVVPIIDVIESSNFYYSVLDPVNFQVGGFTFMGHFTWIDVPEWEKKRRGSDIAPTWSPTMAGGLFAIQRQYYWELGAYDEQMAGWGGENLEMSFRIWQCGGTLETIPCSRVGHVFRSFHPYGLPAHSDTHGINTARMAEVWMDDYAELFYLHRPDLRKNPKIGDVTHRRVLREKLKCKSFQWYLDNIYREKFVPVRDVFGFGRFLNPSSGLCLDTLQREAAASPLGLYPCHARLEPTQHLALSLRGELRDEERCAEVQYARSASGGEQSARRVLMVACHGKQRGQKWRYMPTQQVQHIESRLCLTAGPPAGSDVLVAKCGATPKQLWQIDYTELNGFKMSNDVEPSEQELKLQKLRGQRRISRSLLSAPEDNNKVDDSTLRRHHKRRTKHKKSHKKKNKFILELVRDRVDGRTDEGDGRTDGGDGRTEHLEVDVYCKHRQLYPNNSFVRDLVTILNEKNIKVINNGRVFEHNKVSELVKREHNPPSHRDPSAPSVVPPTESSEPPVTPPPILVREKTKQKSKKRKHKKPLIPTFDQPEADTTDATDTTDKQVDIDVNTDGANDAMDAAEKKIIIEDFVEVKSTTHRASKKRKHKRPRSKTLPTSMTTVSEWDSPMRVEHSPSVEDSPLVASAEPRPERSSGENWPVAESYFRGHNASADDSRVRLAQAERHDDYNTVHYTADEDANEVEDRRTKYAIHALEDAREYSRKDKSGEKSPRGNQSGEKGSRKGGKASMRSNTAPVKVVMKSNLTFNLGDEFFKWRDRTADDVANLLGELVIPANTSHYDQQSFESDREDADSDLDKRYRVKNRDRHIEREGDRDGASETDVLLTGRGMPSVKDDESSADSDSGSAE